MLHLTHKKLEPDAELARPLAAAEGYLFFSLPEEALAELDHVSAPLQETSPFLKMRIRALLHLKRWGEAEALSREGNAVFPDEEEFTVQRVFALDQLNQGGQAVQVLLAAPHWLRRTGILHYNLACYEARLGDLGKARQCIRAAIQINSSFKKNARTDPDLQALWN